MMTTNQEFKNAALRALKGNWAPAVLGTLLVSIILCVASGSESVYKTMCGDALALPGAFTSTYWGLTCGSFLLTVFVVIPLSVGFNYAFNALYVWSDPSVLSNSFGYGFKIYWRAIGGMILVSIFTCLWTLLLVVPGIIKAYSYALTPYILVDNPELSVREAIRRSQRLMAGQKFNLFWLQLSFIGWFILSLATLGIGFLWTIPYYQTSVAVFYNNLKES